MLKEYGGKGYQAEEHGPAGQEDFIEHLYSLYPEKAEAYAQKNEKIKQTIEKIRARRKAYSEAMKKNYPR